MIDLIKQVCEAFCIKGNYLSHQEITVGNINRTYKADFIRPDGKHKSYVVQKVNTTVFRQPEQVMENIDQITAYVHNRYPKKKILHFHHTADRKTYFYRGEEFWRLFNFIPSDTYNASSDPEIIRNAGRAFGDFQHMLGDFDASILHKTIPDFHNTIKRFDTLFADAASDPLGRVGELQAELDWLTSVREKACTLSQMRLQGELPLRVTHNDTKINNVLFQEKGKDAIVVIDLDTVMPGLVGDDFGDAIRFAANKVAEDSPEADRAGIDMGIFRAFTEGFLECTATTLTKAEVDTLALSCFAMTCELATRFLDDYITGDGYFKTNYPGHNLVRAQCQIALAKDIDRHLDEMNVIVHQCYQVYKS